MDISVINPVAGGIFVLSMGYLLKQVSNCSRTIEDNKKDLQNTRENYVTTISCKEDRGELKEMLKEYKNDTKQFRTEQRESTARIHTRLDEILKVTKKNGNH